jgi:signal transduction histidine kinase
MKADPQGETPQLIDIAYRNCERLVELVDDILDMEKIESGNIDYEMSPISIPELIQDAMETNAPYGERFGVTFVIEGDIPETKVSGNHKGLLQVLANLLSNASKYSNEGGSVVISATESDGWATVSVRDEGAEIPEESQASVFERFAKVDSERSKEVPGTDLGFSICRAIIEHHDGEIGVRSKEGEGTTFFFKLPVSMGHY